MTDPATTPRADSSRIGGVLGFAYGVVAYLMFVVVFLYAVAFVADAWFVPKTINRGGWGNGKLTIVAVVVDVGVLLLFAVQHSVMARSGFKDWLTKYLPRSVERSTYVLAANLCLAAILAYWFPITPALWAVTSQPWRGILVAISLSGWGLVFVSTFLINHFDLFGLRQVLDRLRNHSPAPYPFMTPAFYRIVRHPIYLGFTIAFWVTPTMTVGHLLFAVATLGYTLVAIQLEERDLIRTFGQQYRDYRSRVPMLVPGIH